MKAFNKKHKPKHFSKARWDCKNLYTLSMKEKIFTYLRVHKSYCMVRNNTNKKKDKTFKQNIFKLESLSIGKKFMFENKRYKVVNSENCQECSFKGKKCFQLQYNALIPECSELLRKDGKGVIFVETGK